jgi:hypothetical protein
MVDGRDASTAHAVAANFRDGVARKRTRAGTGNHARTTRSRLARLSISLAPCARARRALFAGRVTLVICTLVGPAAASGAPRFHLRGTARIDAHVARSHGELVVSGTVVDDIGAPTPRARLALQISAEASSPQPPRLAALAPMAPMPCSDAWPAPALEGSERLAVIADGAARFCVRLALPTGRYVAHLEANGSGFVDGASIDLPVDLALEPVTLRFDPERDAISLDDDSTEVGVVASTEDDGLTSPASSLPLALSNEAGRVLGNATTDAAGWARFVVPGALFGDPGKGELRVSFAGSGKAGASSYAAAVERRTRVEILAPAAAGGQLPLASSEREVTLVVSARTTSASRGGSGVPTGTIEVRVGAGDGARLVGAAALARGEARVVVTFATPSEGDADTPVRVDYVPDAPWLEASGPLMLSQPLRPPGAWDQIVLALTGAGVVVWLAAGRLPGQRHAGEPSTSGLKIPQSASSVELLANDGPDARSWRGRVIDGHDGAPVAGARVALERPGFERAETIADVTTDAEGSFVLAPAGVQPGDRLTAEGPLHCAHRTPAPAFGEVRVALVSRRRALLDRLVAWARRKGRPYDASPEPTPGHVRRMARAGDATHAWAEAVERAAYSGAAIDAPREAEVDRLAPAEVGPARGPGEA